MIEILINGVQKSAKTRIRNARYCIIHENNLQKYKNQKYTNALQITENDTTTNNNDFDLKYIFQI